MAKNRRAWLAFSMAAAMVMACSTAAWSQQSDAQRKLPELWRDFVHYIKIARGDLAKSFGEAILESGAEPRAVYLLAGKDPVETQNVLARGERLEGMKDVIVRMRKMLREGLQAEASNPGQIAKAIRQLAGTLQEYQIGLQALKRSGEYALPQLLQSLSAPGASPRLCERIRTVLPQLGAVAVRGLSAALQSDKPEVLETVVSALGRIRYGHAAARLKELSLREGLLARVKLAADSALVSCGGQAALKTSASAMFYDLAEKYYYRAESLLPDQRYDTANVWYWQPGLGLVFKPVPRAIFCDIYAMRMARLALAFDHKSQRAVSLWLAANLRREAHLPAGKIDPTHPKGAPGATYYTLAAGPRYLLDVLGRGLKDGHAEVARGAIEALAKTGGAISLVGKTAGGIHPLVQALMFPDRNVRFLAAVAIGDALPDKPFEGSQITVAVLNEALRQQGGKIALVVLAAGRVNELTDAVRSAGYRVIAADTAGKALEVGRQANGVDLVVLGARPNPMKVIAMLRADPAFAAVPVVVVFRSVELRMLAEADRRIVLLSPSAGVAAMGDAVAAAAKLGIGKPLTVEQADQWIIRAAGTVALLGRTGNKVFDISRTVRALTEALAMDKPAVQVAVMEALAVIRDSRAQVAIARIGCNGRIDEAVRLKALSSLSASIRRYGNLLPDAEVTSIMAEVGGKGSAEICTAAAQTLGAMNLPSERIKSLILGT